MQSLDFPISEGRISLDFIVILKSGSNKSESLGREKAPIRKEFLLAVRKTSVMVLHGDDNVNTGVPAIRDWRLLHANADFEAGSKTESAAPKGAVADPEG